MRSKLNIVTALMLVVLCMTGFSITAFASGGDEPPSSADKNIESTEPTEVKEDAPYTYVVNEDGSMVITINGESVTDETVTGGKVVTNGGRLNLRTGAGMEYEVIDQLRSGEEVTVIGTEGEWYEVIVPEKKGYVHSSYLKLYKKNQQESEIDAILLNMIMQFLSSNSADVGVNNSFTPTGNMTMIDDFFQIEAVAKENSPQRDKQFITLQSKNGNTFYLVIDRSGDTENVYFLNLVDEADLMALIEDEDVAKAPVCSCTDKCTVGAIKTDCEVCRTNMSECAGKEPVVTEPEPTAPVDEPTEKKPSGNALPLLALLMAGAGGGAFYWFKIRKPKTKNSGDSDLDDYDYGQDDEETEETELDDSELMAESEDDKA